MRQTKWAVCDGRRRANTRRIKHMHDEGYGTMNGYGHCGRDHNGSAESAGLENAGLELNGPCVKEMDFLYILIFLRDHTTLRVC